MKNFSLIFIAILAFLLFWKSEELSKFTWVGSGEGGSEEESRVTPSTRGVARMRESSRDVAELAELLVNADWEWQRNNGYGRDLFEFRRNVIESWSPEEVEAACRSWMIGDEGEWIHSRMRGNAMTEKRIYWTETLFTRWGYFDHEVALALVAELESEIAVQESTDDDFRIGKASGFVGWRLGSVLGGWAEKEPHEAYRFLVSNYGASGEFTILDGYYAETVGRIFVSLAREDSEFAFSEYRKNTVTRSRVREQMLRGIAEGMPGSTDWAALMTDLEQEVRGVEGEIISGKLLSRWVEHDVDEVMSWYRSNEADWIMPKSRNDPLNFEEKGIPASADSPDRFLFEFESFLGVALKFWVISKPEDAIAWLRKNPRFVPVVVYARLSAGGDYDSYIESEEARSLLVQTLSRKDRETYLRSFAGKDHRSSLLSGFDEENTLGNIRELDLGEALKQELEEKILKHYKKYEDELFPLGDPFDDE